jgi:DNA-binding HxlR family transcriptional regulator
MIGNSNQLIVKSDSVSERRTYGDSCGIARALDLVGERWALLVARELVLGPKRFTDLRAGLPNLSADVLSQRLRELERIGVVRRRKLPPPASARVYELTDWGRELEPVLLALGRWGSRAPLPAEPPELGVDAVVVALKTMYDPAGADATETGYQLRLGEHRFAVRLAGDQIELSRGELESPAAVIETDPATLAALLWHGQPVDAALAAGSLRIEGDKRAARRFLRMFPAPVPVPVPVPVPTV